MSRVDSGHETLFSEDDSPTPTIDDSFDEDRRRRGNSFHDIKTISNKHEDGSKVGPPKLTPVSGVLGQGKVVIRPIAFKPVMTSSGRSSDQRYNSTPSLQRNGHYNSTSDLKSSLTPIPNMDRRSTPQPGRTRYDSLESLRVSSQYISPSILVGGCTRDDRQTPNSTYGRIENHTKNPRGHPRVHHESLCALNSGTPNFNSMGASQRLGGSVSNLSQLSLPRYHNGSSGSGSLMERYGSVNGSNLHLEDLNQTPSPSDSGVVELEAMLKERDSEINYLRETMEQNEQVIFKVYEEKERTWEKELRKIKGIYENRLKASQQKALKMEHMLTMQTYQLQQEKRKLRQEMDDLRREKDELGRQTDELRSEVQLLRSTLEDTEWGLCQKSGEISLLKSQLKDSQGDQTTRGHEMIHMKSQLREYKAQLEIKDNEAKRLQTELQSQVAELRKSLESSRLAAEKQKEAFDEERMTWLEEKEKVIKYQKQLQMNYMQMYRRNKMLEMDMGDVKRDVRITGESQC